MSSDNSSPEIHRVFVESNLETRFVVLLHKDENVSVFKEKLCKEHSQCFPEIGDITIFALKVEWNGRFFHLPDSLNVTKAFDGDNRNWFISVDAAVLVDKGKLMASGSNLNPLLLEEKSETSSLTNLLKSTTLEEEEALKTQIAEQNDELSHGDHVLIQRPKRVIKPNPKYLT